MALLLSARKIAIKYYDIKYLSNFAEGPLFKQDILE